MVINFLGMPEWAVEDVEYAGNDARVHARVAGRPAGCPKCGGKIASKGLRRRLIMHVPSGLRRVGIWAGVRRFGCAKCGSFYEPLPGIDRGRGMTQELVHYIKQVSFEERFSTVASRTGVPVRRVREIFREAVQERVQQRSCPNPRLIGIDELHIGGKYRFVIANLETAHPQLIDMLESRKRAVVLPYLREAGWNKVEAVAMDMRPAYREMALQVWPDCIVVADKFHVLQGATRAVEQVRKRVRDTLPPIIPDGGKSIFFKRAHSLTAEEQQWVEVNRPGFAGGSRS